MFAAKRLSVALYVRRLSCFRQPSRECRPPTGAGDAESCVLLTEQGKVAGGISLLNFSWFFEK